MLRRVLLLPAIAAAVLAALLRAQQPNSTVHEIVISNFSFTPARIVVHRGDTIKWVNRDVVRHNATAADKSWTTGTLMSGAAGSVTATAVGTFNYICTRHPSMRGVTLQRHQSSLISRINNQLTRANEFLAGVAQKLAKHLSPQRYKSIFSGEKDVSVSTERKKLTIFFSDVVNFTATTERMQPEELTALLNEYLTEMSRVAIKHGGSVNKFIGDAILIFFGDYEMRGVEEDARDCVRMAFEMQRRLGELNVKWRKKGIEEPFRSRMGINTGYCNVGNFGSDERMDYTIIGAEANLAARLQSIAKPNGIVMSYETFALVSDMVRAQALDPIRLKGVSREIVPYAVEGHESAPDAARVPVITEHIAGLDLFLDVRAMNSASAERIASALSAALDVVKKVTSLDPSPAASPSNAKTG